MAQKRLLTSEKSKLGNADLATMLKLPGFWDALPPEKRQELYDMLPGPADDSRPHDPDVNPLATEYRTHIEEALRKWQDDLKDGKEDRKWRREAMQAAADRKHGKFDEWKAAERERYWGVKEEAESEKEGEGPSEKATYDVAGHGENEIFQNKKRDGTPEEKGAE